MRNKKWNKKVSILAMLVVFAMAFAACGGKKVDEVSGKITPAESEQKENNDVTATPAETVDNNEQDSTGEQSGTENKDVANEGGKTTSLGRIQGGVYVNEYMGISCELDSAWEFYTAEELQELPENVSELFKDTAMEDQMSNLTYITDMSAENADEMTSMNIIYQKMGIQERLAFSGMTNSDVVDSMLSTQKDFLVETYAQAGINVQEMYKKTVTFCGEERDALYMACDVAGIAYYALQLFDYSLGDYAVTMTVTSFVEDKTDSLLTLFSKYE